LRVVNVERASIIANKLEGVGYLFSYSVYNKQYMAEGVAFAPILPLGDDGRKVGIRTPDE